MMGHCVSVWVLISLWLTGYVYLCPLPPYSENFPMPFCDVISTSSPYSQNNVTKSK